MATVRPRLMLLDTASLYFRAFYGVPTSITAPDGSPVNAVRGLLDMIATLVTTRRPQRLVACWDDDWRPAFRVAAIPSYKAHRVAEEAPNAPGAPGAAVSDTTDAIEETPPGLDAQVPVIVEVLAALGIARIGAPGYEADDVIGTLTARAVQAGGVDVEIVTGDRDLLQLVDDAAGVRVLYIGRGVRNLEVADQAWLAAKYGVPSGDGYADMAVLRGDPSDGLPGVPGIGEKTAVGLVNRFGGLDPLLAAVADGDPSLSPGQRRKLTEAADYLAVAPRVVRVALDAPVTEADDALPQEPADPAALLHLVERWGIGSSVQRVLTAFGWTPLRP